MIPNLLIGNLLSLAAAWCTAKSSLSRDTWHIYIYQCWQCLILSLASVFFNSYAGIVSLLGCALRNYLAATGRLNRVTTLLCLMLVLVPGVILNNRGYIGGIVILANVVYTFGMYLTHRELTIKCNIILNLALWMLYEALILDIPSLIADAIGLGAAAVSVWRLLRKPQNA